ncbi:MAG: hypothetical protein ABI700_00960 [Chloroflexota bacterium]
MLTDASRRFVSDFQTESSTAAQELRQQHETDLANGNDLIRWSYTGKLALRSVYDATPNVCKHLSSTIYDRSGHILVEEFANGSILFAGHIWNETYHSAYNWAYTSGKHNIHCSMEQGCSYNHDDLPEYDEDAAFVMAKNATLIQQLMTAK